MRTLEALKKLAKKLTGDNTIPGDTVDEVINYAEANFEIADAKNVTNQINSKNITDIFESDGTTAKAATSANGLVLTSPDESVWDISIANDGTISGTKRATELTNN